MTITKVTAGLISAEASAIDLNIDANTLYIDASENRVGIGTSSPSAALHVLSPTTLTAKLQGATNAYIDFTDGSVESRIQNSGGLYIGTETNHSTNLKTNGSVRLSVGGTGNVGIGTTAPNTPLEVTKSITFNTIDTFGQFAIKTASGATGDMLNFGVDGANSVAFLQAHEKGTDFIPLVLQRYGGNVGIGVTSPSSLLHLESASSPTLQIKDTTNNATFKAYAQNSNTHLANTSNHDLIIDTNNTERMRITSGGTVLIGKSALDNTTAGVRLNASGQATFARDGSLLYLNRKTTDGNSIEFAKDNSLVGSIGINGGRPYLVNNVDGGIHVATDGYGRALLLPADQTGAPEDNLHYLGSSSYRWRDIYLSGAAYIGGTATANALNDYEEGTWTPSISSAGEAYSTQIGTYVKIGKLVVVNFTMILSTAPTSGSNVFIQMPFTPSGTTTHSFGAPFSRVSLTDTTANESATMLSTYAGVNNFYVYNRSTGAVYTSYTSWGTGQYSATITYFTDS